MYISATVLAVLTTPVALADDAVNTSAASNYFDASRALFNNNRQPYPPATRGSSEIASRYFDADRPLSSKDG